MAKCNNSKKLGFKGLRQYGPWGRPWSRRRIGLWSSAAPRRATLPVEGWWWRWDRGCRGRPSDAVLRRPRPDRRRNLTCRCRRTANSLRSAEMARRSSDWRTRPDRSRSAAPTVGTVIQQWGTPESWRFRSQLQFIDRRPYGASRRLRHLFCKCCFFLFSESIPSTLLNGSLRNFNTWRASVGNRTLLEIFWVLAPKYLGPKTTFFDYFAT